MHNVITYIEFVPLQYLMVLFVLLMHLRTSANFAVALETVPAGALETASSVDTYSIGRAVVSVLSTLINICTKIWYINYCTYKLALYNLCTLHTCTDESVSPVACRAGAMETAHHIDTVGIDITVISVQSTLVYICR